MYKEDLALDNLQGLMCHKTQSYLIKSNEIRNFFAHNFKMRKRVITFYLNPPPTPELICHVSQRLCEMCHCGVMVKAVGCGIVFEFELQSCPLRVHFRSNTQRERYETPLLS